MTANPDQQVDPAALKRAAKGLNDTVGELSSLGFAETGEVGRGFSVIELSGLELGHAGLTAALQQFGARWSWGVRALVHDGDEFADRLHLAAGLSYDNDQYVQGTFKDLVSDGMGSPDASDEQVEKASWQQVWHDNPLTQVEHPESAQAEAQALSHAGQSAVAEGKDMAASSPLGLLSSADKWAKLMGTPSSHEAHDTNGGHG